jgi:hypothetical protein
MQLSKLESLKENYPDLENSINRFIGYLKEI